MKQKTQKCKYCQSDLNAKTTRAEFCSPKCRVYWNRENAVKSAAPPVDPPKQSDRDISKKKNQASHKAENKPDDKNSKTVPPPKNNTIKTLQDLKDACPEDLRGLDRTIWIAEQKEKLNIR